MKKENLLKLKKNLLITSLILGTSLAGINNSNINLNAQSNIEETTDENRLYDTDEIISYYCKVFSLREDIVKSKLNEMTKNFSSPGWQYGHCINNVFYKDKEFAILSTIRDMYYNPSNYGFDNSVRTEEIYETDMEIEEMVYKYASLYEINKEVALSIVYCECGTAVDSYNYRNNNNPAGIGPNMYFLNKEVGVIYFCNMLKNSYGCEKDSSEGFLNSIAGIYCEIPDHWRSLTLPNYYKLQKDYLYFIDEDEKKNYDIQSYNDKNYTLK